MNLTLFFRLIMMSIFQSQVTYGKKAYMSNAMNYDNQLFFCPVVHAKDGFSVSLQCHHANYCESDAGYRTFSPTMISVEFGFTSTHETLMDEYAESEGDTTSTVGRIPITMLEEVFEKHGGIDWEKTISIEAFNKLVFGK